MNHGTTALKQDEIVFLAMDHETAQVITTLLDSHMAGDVMAYNSPAFKFLRALSGLGLPYRHLHRDKELSKHHGHSVVFMDTLDELEEGEEYE